MYYLRYFMYFCCVPIICFIFVSYVLLWYFLYLWCVLFNKHMHVFHLFVQEIFVLHKIREREKKIQEQNKVHQRIRYSIYVYMDIYTYANH